MLFRSCKNCGATFHVTLDQPKEAGICDKCQGELYQRDDDKEEVIANRLSVYANQTEPIIKYYEGANLLKTISALGEISDISKQAIAALS